VTGTRDVKAYTFTHQGKVIHLFDTPGFDFSGRSDSDVLRGLAYYLTTSYKKGFRLTGIIYLHPITSPRLSGSAYKNLRTFRKLCGRDSMSSVILATTMWDGVSHADGDRRERELREPTEFWDDMIREGSSVYRHTNDHNSAINVISHLTDRNSRMVLVPQREMVEGNLDLEDTAAGREVDYEMRKQHARFERDLKHTREEIEAAMVREEKQLEEETKREQIEYEQKLAAIQRGRDELRVNMENLIAEKNRQHRQAIV
jgi:hypothetical protein